MGFIERKRGRDRENERERERERERAKGSVFLKNISLKLIIFNN